MMTLVAADDDTALREIAASIGAHALTAGWSMNRQTFRTAGVLTKREVEVAQLLAEEESNRRIAEALGISERTVEHHVESILQRLGVRSRWLVTQNLIAQYK